MLDVRRKRFYSDADTKTCTASFYTQRLLAYKKYSSLNTTKNQRHFMKEEYTSFTTLCVYLDVASTQYFSFPTQFPNLKTPHS